MAKERSVADLEKQLKSIEELITRQGTATAAQLAAQERITKELARQQSLREEELNTTKEIDDTLRSIASTQGKSSKMYKKTQAQLGVIQGSVESIESWSSKWVGAAKKNKESIIGAAKGYRNVNAQVLKNIALVGEGKESQENIADILDDQIKKHKEVLTSITSNTAQSKKLRTELEGEVEAMEKLGKATKRAGKDVEAMTRMGQAFAGTMAGSAIDKTLKAFGKKDGLGGVVQNLTSKRTTTDGKGGVGGMFTKMLGGVSRFLGPIALAVGGIMAAAEFFDSGGAAKMAMRMAVLQGNDPMAASDKTFKMSAQYRQLMVEQNYGLPLKLKQQAEQDYLQYSQSVAEDGAKYRESLISDEIDYRMSLESDAIQFRQQQASAELDANLSRQKTLFTSAMGYMKNAIGVSERALQAIGSSTQAVLDTVKEYGYTLGIALKDQMALSAASQGLAVRYGTSATEVFKMADTFRLMNKTSAKVGANLVAGLEVLAKKNDMSPAQLYKEMADAQADILRLTSMTGDEYARQAIQLGNMNTSMASMLKASDSMVLNYKDSIKAEMSLSAMLGKNVNLSEVRAKLMSGDEAGGAAALKTALGGQDIGKMNAFQKQALSQATGMGIQELMQLTQSKGATGVKGTLQEKNALKTGRDIAKGALSQDIANAAAKLALDQKNRAEMLKFEQAKRLSMLFVEQKFRLNAIEREFKYREDREKLGAEQAIESAKMDMFKEVASEQIMSLTNVYKDSFGEGKFDAAKVAEYQAKVTSQMNTLQQAMVSGRISDAEVSSIQQAIFNSAMKGQTVDLSQFAGVQKYMADYKAAVDKQEIIAKEYVKNKGVLSPAFVKKLGITKSEIDQAVRNRINVKETKTSRHLGMGQYTTDSKFEYSLKKAVASAVVKTQSAVAVGPNGQPITTATKPGAIKLPPDSPTLSDAQAQTKLQTKMVELLGASATILQYILVKESPDIQIDKMTLSKKLLNTAHSQFAIAGLPK